MSTILAIIGIVILILYFTLGSGDNGETTSTLMMARVARVARVAMGITTSYKKLCRAGSISWNVQEIFMSTGKPSWQWVS